MRITNTMMKAQLVALVQKGRCIVCTENHNGAMVADSGYIYCSNCHSQKN